MKLSVKIFCTVLIIGVSLAFLPDEKQSLVKSDFELAEIQYSRMLSTESDYTKYPRTTAKDSSLVSTDLSDWTAGFWPGNLWLMYDYDKNLKWKDAAIKWTTTLKSNQFNKSTHDLGFMMYCSYGNAYRLTGDKTYRDVLLQSANSLVTRFNPNVGCIKSWDQRQSWDGKTMWHYPVIIDNMMNLELLFFASRETGNPIYRNIAIRHAETTMKNHIRPDYSSYHVVNYDSISGKVLNRETCQGYANNSTWARGEAWGIYGFTMVYRETKDKRFLKTAEKMADFYLNNNSLPGDKVPYWDFNVNQAGYRPLWKYDPSKYNYIPRDASAAAVVCSALMELSTYLGKDGLKYKKAALDMLISLSSKNYLAAAGTNNNFLLMHSVGSFPHGAEIDKPLVYADYYFLEALLRYQQLARTK